jgi:hypothetical protein
VLLAKQQYLLPCAVGAINEVGNIATFHAILENNDNHNEK